MTKQTNKIWQGKNPTNSNQPTNQPTNQSINQPTYPQDEKTGK